MAGEKLGPAYPAYLSEKLHLEHQTVKNQLSKLRKDGKIENTGDKDSNGANQVQLTPEYDPQSLLSQDAA